VAALEPKLDSVAGTTGVVGELALLSPPPVDVIADGDGLTEPASVPLVADAMSDDVTDFPVSSLAVVPMYVERGP
jgi:hypothetical protein